LASLNVIAALYVELLHGRRDFRHDTGLIERIQRSLAFDDAPDGRLRHRGHLHRHGRFVFLFCRFIAPSQQYRSGNDK
jgi:hypothetical protein